MAAASLTTETAMNSSFGPVSIHDDHPLIHFWQSRIVVSFFIVNIILGLPTNLYVLWLIISGAGSGVASELFALNLSVCEIINCVGSVPYISYILTSEDCMNCPLYYTVSFFFGLLSLGRPFFQCCVCVERYVAVVHPITFMKYKSLRYRLAGSGVSWLILTGHCLGNMIAHTEIWLYYVLLPHYLLLFSIKVICSLVVLRALRHPGPGWSVRDAETNSMKKKAFWVIVIILVAMFISFGPTLFFLFLFSILSDMQRQKAVAFIFSVMILTGFVHPLLYLHRSGKLPFIKHM